MFPEGNNPVSDDGPVRSWQKIVQLLNLGGGVIGGVGIETEEGDTLITEEGETVIL